MDNNVDTYMAPFKDEQEQMKEYCRRHIVEILDLEPDQYDGYVCPICGSGSGPNGTGMTTQDGIRYRCWVCEKTRDVFDFAQELEDDGGLKLEGYNIFDKVYRHAGLYDMTPEQLKALYNDDSDAPKVTAHTHRHNNAVPKAKAKPCVSSVPANLPDYRSRYKNAASALWSDIGINAREYLQSRGLSEETLKKFSIGLAIPRYCGRLSVPASKVDQSMAAYPVNNGYVDTTNGKGAILIPVSVDCYVLRNLNKDSSKRYAKYTEKGNPFKVNNEALLYTNCSYIFIVEGYFDMLSVAEVGMNAIAIGTKGAPSDLQRAITRAYEAGRLYNKTLVICEDNDASCQDGLKKIKEFLDALPGVRYCCCDPCAGITDSNGNPLKDANDALVNNRELFEDNLKNAFKQQITTVTVTQGDVSDITEEAGHQEQQQENELETLDETATVANNTMVVSPVSEVLTSFLADDGARYTPISTGIGKLDAVIGGGLRVGLTGLQGLSGFGKSTLSTQVCENIAKQGKPVLYVSLEMGICDIISKDLARGMWLNQLDNGCMPMSPIVKSSVDILTRAATYDNWSDEERELFEHALEQYRETSQNLYIVEGGMVSTPEAVHTVDRIELCMKDIHETTGSYPVVCVDYLQKLKGATINSYQKNVTEKQIIDDSVFNLRQLATKYSVPIIVILSMNRQSYNQGTSLSSAKGSGDIEYSVDVLLGIERPEVADDKAYVDVKQEAANSEAGLSKTIKLKVIKNRYGVPGVSTELEFYGKQCCFMNEMPEMLMQGIGDDFSFMYS